MEDVAMTILPGWLNLDSLSIVRLAALLLSLVLCVYLLQIRRKSLATLFLAGLFFGAFLFNAASFFEFAGAYYWQPRTLRTVFVDLFIDIGPSFAMVCLLLFAYHFPRFRSAERREFRIVFPLSLAVNAGVLGLNIYNNFFLLWQFSDVRLWNIYWLVFYCSLATQFLGATVLLFRKAMRLSRHGSRFFLEGILRPKGQDARAARALGTILLLPMLAVAASLAMTYGVLPFSVATYLTWIGLLLFYLGFIVTYLNHTSDPLTLQLKLLGVTLVLILSTMGSSPFSWAKPRQQTIGLQRFQRATPPSVSPSTAGSATTSSVCRGHSIPTSVLRSRFPTDVPWPQSWTSISHSSPAVIGRSTSSTAP
jgi:hypothetical protein